MKKTKTITKQSLSDFYTHLLEIITQEEHDLWFMKWPEYTKKYPLVDYADYCRSFEKLKFKLSEIAHDHFESYK